MCSKSSAWTVRLLCLTTALVLAAPATTQANDKLLPDNTEMVFGFNIKTMTQSPLFTKHFQPKIKEQMEANQQFMAIMSAMNFDPMRDLTSITVAVSNFKLDVAGGPPQPDADPIIVLRGNFDVAKIEAGLGSLIGAANNERVTTSKLGARTLYEIKEGNRPMFACFVDNTTMIGTSSKEDLQKALDRHEGKSKSKQSDAFSKLLAKADTKQAMWAVIALPDSIRTMAQGMPQGEVIEKIQGMTMFVSAKEGMVMELNTFSTDAAGVGQIKQMFEQIKQLAGVFSLQAQDPDISKAVSDIVSNITISEGDNMVSLRIEVKSDVVEMLMKKAGGN
jgi:hypothetical protein